MKYKGGLHKCIYPINLDKLRKIIQGNGNVQEEVFKYLDHQKYACSNFEKKFYELTKYLLTEIRDNSKTEIRDNRKVLEKIKIWLSVSENLLTLLKGVLNLTDFQKEERLDHYQKLTTSLSFKKILEMFIEEFRKKEKRVKLNDNERMVLLENIIFLEKYSYEKTCPSSVDILSIKSQKDMDDYLSKMAFTCFFWKNRVNDIIAKNNDHASIGFVIDWMKRVRRIPEISMDKRDELFHGYDDLLVGVIKDFSNFIKDFFHDEREKGIELPKETLKELIDYAAIIVRGIVNSDEHWTMMTKSIKSKDDQNMLYDFYLNYYTIYFINLKGRLTEEPFDEKTIEMMWKRFR